MNPGYRSISIDRFEAMCGKGDSELDTHNNQMCPAAFETALLVIGGIIDTAGLVMQGKRDNSFCAVRNPGHHAEGDDAIEFLPF